MKLYATVSSERATKGQGGKYLDIEIFTTNKEHPTHRVRVWTDEKTGNTMVDTYRIHFGTERQYSRDVVFTGIETKGKRQKGEQ